MMRFLTYITLLLISVNIAGASSPEFIGVIGAAIGDVKNQKNEKLSNGSKIYFGDTIEVSEQSNAQVLFLDQTVITIGEKSELTVDEFIYDPETNDGKMVTNIKSGTVKVITGQISKKNPDNLEVNVTTGTIGARGTEFVVVAESNDENKIILLGPGPNNTLGMMPGTLQVSDGLNTIEIIKPGYESVLTN
jgi:hypothetical protein|tara:strand:- start:1554 stop:2126 length:573 start_codon:yes stop_codon:yes gene_type:complete